MDLSNGINLVSIPGPTVLPDRVRAALAEPMPDIYAGALIKMSDRVVERLPSLARTDGKALIMVGNGHAAWQMAVSNLLLPGDRVLVLESGRFAAAWGGYFALSGAEIEAVPGDERSAVDPAAVEEHLRRPESKDIKAILVVQTDTASSVRNDLPAIRAAIDAAGHDALLLVDCIATIGCEPYEMDEWGIDLTIGASQKGLMCPPGVAFVWVGSRAVEAYERVKETNRRVGYLDWEKRLNPSVFYETYAGTPPVAHIRALNAALDLIDEEGGLEAVWNRHRVMGEAVRAAVDMWSTPGGLEFNITNPEHRSNAVTTVRTGSISARRLQKICKKKAGVVIGIGLSMDSEDSFRIGHMGHIHPASILGTLGTIEAALHAMDAPVGGSGVAAAAAVVGEGLAE